MIAYDLQCVNGHSFEGWFEDEKAYLDQKKRGLVACPMCEDTTVSRMPSAFAIKSSTSGNRPKLSTDQLALIGSQVAEYVEKNFDNVGPDFAKEALKMHFGVTEPRNIRGTSTQEEEKTLQEEGVEFFKIPLPSSSKADN
ncbi:MAG: hypothetical protein AMJ54_01420 [Deltaproteobacteria bacterium SG8_13]|nr:MAG: hypothetical protein AMJ54_01420 [Deltaproteobacteria bacterium SG8_13]